MTDKKTISTMGIAIKHYSEDEGATIKWDGGYIEIDGDREDAEELVIAIIEIYKNSEEYLEAIYAAAVELEKAEIIQEFKDSKEYKDVC